MTNSTPYSTLTPDLILDALEAAGYSPTGGLTALNSYENRVYQAEMDDGSFRIAKFYRPGRWTEDQIREEHAFVRELVEEELSVVAAERQNGDELNRFGGFVFSVYPRQGGHTPDIEREEDLEVLSRALARMHVIGAQGRFQHRRTLTIQGFAKDNREWLLKSGLIPLELEKAYATTTDEIIRRLHDPETEDNIRLHGDCHLGNILWRNDTPHFVDFDDCMTGPPIQDIWMLLSGEREDRLRQLGTIADAYEMFATFPAESLHLIESLRALRLMNHSAWIGRRWEDPAFPLAFPDFGSVRYWSNHILELREQLSALDEPPLIV